MLTSAHIQNNYTPHWDNKKKNTPNFKSFQLPAFYWDKAMIDKKEIKKKLNNSKYNNTMLNLTTGLLCLLKLEIIYYTNEHTNWKTIYDFSLS